MIKIYFITLGCPKNLVDSEYMQGLILESDKYRIIDRIEEAELIIINTCGFINDAKEESINTIINAGLYKKEGKCRALIVSGCLTQRYKSILMEEMPEIDAILGTGNFDTIVSVIERVLDNQRINEIKKPTFDYTCSLPRNLTTANYAYVKIAEGCNHHCSYCTIPSIRGPLYSRSIDDIYQEVNLLVSKGIKEIILIAQDTTSYGIDLKGKPMLVELLEKLLEIKGINWFRLMYTYPDYLDENIIDLIQYRERICNYLDMPIQHASSKIRNLMNRKGNYNDLINKIKKIRRKIPDIALRTTLIVGFPGEDENDFAELVKFVKEVKFERLGVFKYSREEGTPAYNMSNQINEDTKEYRYNKIMELQKGIAYKNNKNMIDKIIEVIIEEKYDDTYYLARTAYDAPEIDNLVYISGGNINIGDIINCRITDAYEYDLIGENVNESTK